MKMSEQIGTAIEHSLALRSLLRCIVGLNECTQ